MGINFNIIRFMGAAVELDGFRMITGVQPNTNHATCNYQEFSRITLGVAGSLQFFYSNLSAPDVTISNITCVDAQPIEFIAGQPLKYRLTLMDDRWHFIDPRGGRLAVGLINPSTQITPDADRTNVPQARTMTECIQACLTEMGVNASIPSINIDPPQELKWFGSHAPSELEKLLSLCDLVFCLQMDGTYTISKRNSGSMPTIPPGRQLQNTTITGADCRGDTVVFASYPTQVVNTITEADIDPANDLTVVYKNKDGAWQKIDNCGVYGSGSAITEMNNHFQNTTDPAAQSACYRFLRLNPDKFDPINSPILRKTFKDGNPSSSDPNGLPDQIEIQIKANCAIQDPNTKLWKNGTSVVIPVDRVLDGNVLSLHHRLVKLNSSSGSMTADLEKNCVALDLSSDIKIRISVSSSSWDGSDSLFKPEYFLCGYNGTASSPSQMSQSDSEAALTKPGTLVVPIAELVAMRKGLSADPVNLSTLQNKCQALAPRYLKDPSNSPVQMAAVGFLTFTLDGMVHEVELDQKSLETRFKINQTFRPTGHSSHKELQHIRKPKDSHPHEAKTAGARAARGEAGSSQPVQAMLPFIPPAGPAPYYTFLVKVSQNGGSNGSSGGASSFTYDVFDEVAGSQIGKKLSPMAPRYSAGFVTAATLGLAYYDLQGNANLLWAYEVLSTIACSS